MQLRVQMKIHILRDFVFVKGNMNGMTLGRHKEIWTYYDLPSIQIHQPRYKNYFSNQKYEIEKETLAKFGNDVK